MRVECCGTKRKARTFVIEPAKGYSEAVMAVLEECPICGAYVLVLMRVDDMGEVKPGVEYRNKAARKFFKKVSILFEVKNPAVLPCGSWYLKYSEFGKVKKCYSNLTSLKIGMFDYL